MCSSSMHTAMRFTLLVEHHQTAPTGLPVGWSIVRNQLWKLSFICTFHIPLHLSLGMPRLNATTLHLSALSSICMFAVEQVQLTVMS